MSYENDQLNKYDIAEADAILAAARPSLREQIDANKPPENFGQPEPQTQKGGAMGDIGLGVVKGAEAGAKSTMQAIADTVGAPVDFVNAALGKVGLGSEKPFMGTEFLTDMKNRYVEGVNALVPEPAQKAYQGFLAQKYDNELLGTISEVGSQFTIGAVPAAQAIRGLTSASPYVRGLMWGALADYAAFEAETPTFTESFIPEAEAWLAGATPEERTAFGNVIMNIVEKHSDDPAFVNRARNTVDGMVLGFALEGAVRLAITAAKLIPWKTAGAGLAAGAVAGSEEAEAAGSRGNLVKEFFKAFTDKGVRDKGGIILNPEKAKDELRLHKQRIQNATEKGTDYPGAPANERTVIKAPPGKPDVVVGDVEPEDWVQRIESGMSDDEIFKAAKWYDIVFGEFQKRAGGDPKETKKLIDAWFAGQQQRSPEATLTAVLQIYEQLNRGVPKDEITAAGLPSANKIMIDIITGSEITGGAGQKISDFLDSGYNKNVRSYMNNDPDGGSPFVVDIHTARDTGLVDQTLINSLKKLGYEVPDNLKTDFGEGGIKGTKYESRSQFGHRLTDYLNKIEWKGKSDWETYEIQAIGWNQMSKLTAEATGVGAGGDVRSAFAVNTRRISMEVDPGAGSPWAIKYGEAYSSLKPEQQVSINNEVTARAIELVNEELGIKLGENVHGTGGWELFQNPSTVQQAIATKETAVQAAARLGLLLNQTEVWVNSVKPMTKTPQSYAVDIVQAEGNDLRQSEVLTALFNAIIEKDTNKLFRGYQPIVIDGQPGIRILIPKETIKDSPLSLANAKQFILDFTNNELAGITDGLNIDTENFVMESEIIQLKNDWTKDKAGGNYKNRISGQPGQNAESEFGLLDTHRGELEDLFSRLIDKAKAGDG